MPLPPAPTKRAALLSPDAHDAPARSSHGRNGRRSADRRTEQSDANGPQPLELFDRHASEAGAAIEPPPLPRAKAPPRPAQEPAV